MCRMELLLVNSYTGCLQKVVRGGRELGRKNGGVLMGRKERIIGVDTVYARRCNKTENGLF